MHYIPVEADSKGALDDGADELGGGEDGSLGCLLGLPLSLPEGVLLDGLDEQPLVGVILLHKEEKKRSIYLHVRINDFPIQKEYYRFVHNILQVL